MNSPEQKLSPGIILGILLLPYFFVWRLLKPGYSTTARVLSFGWLVVLVAVFIAQLKGQDVSRDSKGTSLKETSGAAVAPAEYGSGVAAMKLRDLLQPGKTRLAVKSNLELYPLEYNGRHFFSCHYSDGEECGLYEAVATPAESKPAATPGKYNSLPGVQQQADMEYHFLKIDTFAGRWVQDELPQSTLTEAEAKQLIHLQAQVPEYLSLKMQKLLAQELPAAQVRLQFDEKDAKSGFKRLVVMVPRSSWMALPSGDKRRLMNVLIDALKKIYPSDWTIRQVFVQESAENVFAEAEWAGAKSAPTIKIHRE